MSAPIDLSDLPKRLVEDPIARTWATEFRRREIAGETHSLWLPVMVDERIVDAVRLVQKIGGPVGPKVLGRGWPAVSQIMDDLETAGAIDVEGLPVEADETRPSRVQLSPRRVSELEAALYWPAQYLGEHKGCRNVFALWLRCKAHRRNFRKACSKAGWSEATAKRRRWQASTLIAIGLMRDGAASPPLPKDSPRD